MTDQWMSIVEYARTYSISDMTVRRRIKNGKLKAVLREGKYFIQVDGAASEPSFEMSSKDIQAKGASVSNGYEAGSSPVSSWGGGRSFASHQSSSAKVEDSMDSDQLKSMLSYCERSLNRINSIERHIKESFQSKLMRLESELRAKDLENKQLKQQVEDLEILIKMYDAKT